MGIEMAEAKIENIDRGVKIVRVEGGIPESFEIYVTRAYKPHRCKYCGGQIGAGEKMVVVAYKSPLVRPSVLGLYHSSCFEKSDWAKEFSLVVLKTTIRRRG
jgi:hypothetical protein